MPPLEANGKDKLANQEVSNNLGELQAGTSVPPPAGINGSWSCAGVALGFRENLKDQGSRDQGDASDAFHTWLKMRMVVIMIRRIMD
ncbi:microtubule associated protein [Aspergillus luchuensis]|uniref:Microtubule associated protein n=1 Tax=Aspergillus kawachii TaxID=1069201 RepID=A0A146F5G4_ASPKA|nr:microtubule associated protein [Aspergillus luchuensis]